MRGTAASCQHLSKLSTKEHGLASQLLSGVVPGCHFWEGVGAGKWSWVADGVKQERRQCLFANTARRRSIIARRS